MSYSGDADVPISQIAASLIVTRSTVVVITLLLLVLAIAALAQAARLFTDARMGDRQLMRARGASAAQIVGVAAIEAAFVGVVAALVSPLLARLVYSLIALQPAMAAAGVPRDSGLGEEAWLTSAGLGALFVVVLVGSVLGRSTSFVEAEQSRSRSRRVTGLLRSGLDLGVVVVAGLAFWQLEIYRTPVGSSASDAVDPVLVVAPALVLLAGALISLRLLPLLAGIADRAGSRTRGALISLAAWEIARRSQRVASVVLLLTLALAVGAFSQTFLATWRQSQVDQAGFAVGPDVRVPAETSDSLYQQNQLRAGAVGAPQPVLRRTADAAADDDGQEGEDTTAVVLGLTQQARAMLDTGRVATEGGAAGAELRSTSSGDTEGVALPGNPVGIGLTVRIGNVGTPLPGVSADIRAIVEDGGGVLSTVDLGDVAVDGQSHHVSAELPAAPKGARLALPLRFDGFQSALFESNPATYVPNPDVDTDVAVRGISSVVRGPGDSTVVRAATVPSSVHWYGGISSEFGGTSKAVALPGWQAALQLTIDANVGARSETVALTGWSPVSRIPAILSGSLASTLTVKRGAILELQFASAIVSVDIQRIIPRVPGSTDASLLTPSAAAGADAASTGAIVVDHGLLERSIIQFGAADTSVDEWWVGVPAGSARHYVATHPVKAGAGPIRSAEILALQMQNDPLRVSTQAALWLAISVAAILAAIGFAVHSAQALSARRVEFAQLRAIGLSRRRLIALIGAEALVLCILGVIFGLSVGLTVGVLSGPLIALSPNGAPAVPPVQVIIPWVGLALLVLTVAIVLGIVLVAVARAQRSSNPAGILREADNG